MQILNSLNYICLQQSLKVQIQFQHNTLKKLCHLAYLLLVLTCHLIQYVLNRDKLIEEQIIKPQSNLIKELHYENKINHIEHKYKKKIKELEKENKGLYKVIDKFKDNLKKFLKWLCHKFSYPCEDDLIRDFNKETYSYINFEKQLDTSHFEKEDNEIDFEM